MILHMVTTVSKKLTLSQFCKSQHKIRRVFKTINTKSVTGPALTCMLAANFATVNAGQEQVFEPEDPRLRTAECLKNASGLSVDSSSAVLSQTVYAVQKIEKEYEELTLVLVRQTEIQLQILGDKEAEEKIADIILETRNKLDAVKQRRQDLQLLFSSAEKLSDAAAEVAFIAGMTFASTSMGERLYSAQAEVRRCLMKSADAEQRLQIIQVKVIEEMGRMAERDDKGNKVTDFEKMLQEDQKNKDTDNITDDEEDFDI